MRTALNWGFVLRGSAGAMAALVLLAGGGALWVGQAFLPVPYAPPPPPPTILAPRGELPPNATGLQLWVRRQGEAERLAGSAFLLALPDGLVVGVTAAHNLAWGDVDRILDSMTLRIANRGEGGAAEDIEGQAGLQVVGLHGAPGRPRRFGLDLSSDRALLALDGEVAGLFFEPDPRGGAQAGERILLLSGLDGRGYEGIVFQSEPHGIWSLMEGTFDPSRMSGSPAVSLHTGKVVGMAVAAGWREGRLVLGLHPVGALVEQGISDQQRLELNPADG